MAEKALARRMRECASISQEDSPAVARIGWIDRQEADDTTGFHSGHFNGNKRRYGGNGFSVGSVRRYSLIRRRCRGTRRFGHHHHGHWILAWVFDEMALVSFYTQWLGLSSAAVLCAARKPPSGFDERSIAVICYLLILIASYTVAELAWWVVNPVDDAGALIQLSRGELILRTLSVSAIVGALVLRYFYVQFHWKQRIASEASARLDALQTRIRPHFFFNCMNTIASLTRSDPKLAERAVEDLADLFRGNLADARARVPINEEIAFVERYLNIERLRLGDRLAVDWQIDEMPGGARLPLLSLQPIVENAIYHGIESSSAGGIVEIRARVLGGQLEVTVTNPFNE